MHLWTIFQATRRVDLPSELLLNQARAGRSAPGFLKLLSCGRWYACVCACVCVSTPRAIKNHSREMKSE